MLLKSRADFELPSKLLVEYLIQQVHNHCCFHEHRCERYNAKFVSHVETTEKDAHYFDVALFVHLFVIHPRIISGFESVY